MNPWLVPVYVVSGIPSIILYISFLYIKLKYPKDFAGSFYGLYSVSVIINLLTYINTYITVKCRDLPFLIGFYTNVTENYPLYPIHFMCIFTFYFLQTSMFVVIQFNRFTAIYFPFHYEQIWRWMLWISLSVIILHSIALSQELLFVKIGYYMNGDTLSLNSTTASSLSNVNRYLKMAGYVYTFLSVTLNIFSIGKLLMHKSHTSLLNQKQERNMMVVAASMFVVQLFGVFNNEFLSTVLKSSFSVHPGLSALSTSIASDVITLMDSYVVLIFNRDYRRKLLHIIRPLMPASRSTSIKVYPVTEFQRSRSSQQK